MGGPCYLPWNFETKHKPSNSELKNAINKLNKNWPSEENAVFNATKPYTFTGKKGRCLVCLAEETYTPPWGTWNSLSSDNSKRRAFTDYRKKINEIIKPLVVDHITFITAIKKAS